MKRLSKESILELHDEAIRRFGGSFGIRDNNLFESQCVAPYQTFEGKELYPTLYDKAVRYLFGFAANQIFFDGNKRTAVITMLTYLDINGIELDIRSEELEKIGFAAAQKLIKETDVVGFLVSRTL